MKVRTPTVCQPSSELESTSGTQTTRSKTVQKDRNRGLLRKPVSQRPSPRSTASRAEVRATIHPIRAPRRAAPPTPASRSAGSLHVLKANSAVLRVKEMTRVFKRDASPFAAPLVEGAYDLDFADPP